MSPKKQKTVASAITAGVLLICFLIMSFTAIPQQDLLVERYDEINWTRFIPTPVPVITPKKVTANKPKVVEKTAVQEPTIKRVDLNDLQNQLKLSDLSIQTKSASAAGKRSSQPAASNIKVAKTDISSLSGDLNLAMDNSSSLTRMPQRGQGKSSSGKIQIQAASGAASGSGLETLGKSIGANLKGPSARGKQVKMGTIQLQELGDVNGDLDAYSPNYKALIDWMKRNPVDLPPIVKRFMDYQSGDLTSRVAFTIDNRNFDMMLLCVEATYEVRIVLIEKRDVTYLIDQGFQKKSNFLRVGKVDRLANREILKFGTNLKPAGSNRTNAFYQVFISWWESLGIEN